MAWQLVLLRSTPTGRKSDGDGAVRMPLKNWEPMPAVETPPYRSAFRRRFDAVMVNVAVARQL